jgi:tryptophan synthase alpha chain
MLAIYLTAGYPSVETTIKALRILDKAGIDIIELGVPFSDPLADGPVIQRASHAALANGVNLDRIFEMVGTARAESIQAAGKGLDNIILFSYYNPLFAYGFDKLIARCLEHKVRGVLIPDLPVDEATELRVKFQAAGLHLVLLAAITSTDERLVKIAQNSSPFIYLVSRIGTTGSNEDLRDLRNAASVDDNDARLRSVISKLRAAAPDKLIGLGFGIDSPEKVREAYALGADIAIIGSKAITVMEEDAKLEAFSKFISSLNLSKVR